MTHSCDFSCNHDPIVKQDETPISADAAVSILRKIADNLEGYADNYDSMARQNPANPRVNMTDVAVDIRQNMKGFVLEQIAATEHATIQPAGPMPKFVRIGYISGEDDWVSIKAGLHTKTCVGQTSWGEHGTAVYIAAPQDTQAEQAEPEMFMLESLSEDDKSVLFRTPAATSSVTSAPNSYDFDNRETFTDSFTAPATGSIADDEQFCDLVHQYAKTVPTGAAVMLPMKAERALKWNAIIAYIDARQSVAAPAPLPAQGLTDALCDSTLIGMAAESGLFGTIPQMLHYGRAVIAADRAQRGSGK